MSRTRVSYIIHHITSHHPEGHRSPAQIYKIKKITAAPVFREKSQVPAPCLSNSLGEFRSKKAAILGLMSEIPRTRAPVRIFGENLNS